MRGLWVWRHLEKGSGYEQIRRKDASIMQRLKQARWPLHHSWIFPSSDDLSTSCLGLHGLHTSCPDSTSGSASQSTRQGVSSPLSLPPAPTLPALQTSCTLPHPPQSSCLNMSRLNASCFNSLCLETSCTLPHLPQSSCLSMSCLDASCLISLCLITSCTLPHLHFHRHPRGGSAGQDSLLC